jgi:hypothetical protein
MEDLFRSCRNPDNYPDFRFTDQRTFCMIYFIIYIVVNVVIALIQRDIRAFRLKTGNPNQINHTLWWLIYSASILPVWFLTHNLCLIGSILLQHAWVFSPVFNIMIGMPPFNLSKTTTSIFDQTLVKIGFKSTEWVMLVLFTVSVILLFI